MLPKTEDWFRAELEEARKTLQEQGRDVSAGDSTSDDAGITCDFELPYSSLATILVSKWKWTLCLLSRCVRPKGMNKLPTNKRVMILNILVEGMSMWSISRTVGISINTVTKLLVEAGEACAAYHDETVRNVKASKVQCDEIWSFCYKNKNVEAARSAPEVAADVWTWTGIDADSKMILSYEIGDRSGATAIEFMDDLRSRLANRVQLTTDGHKAYLEAVEGVFGGDVDFAQLVKLYGGLGGKTAERKYSPATCTGIKKRSIEGNPDMAHVSTSCVERQNLSMCMGMRRFTRLTNGFSKKLENHLHMPSLYFVHYNFTRIHKTLKCTPAMEAGISDTLYDMEWIVSLIDAREPAPKKRGPYKKRISNWDTAIILDYLNTHKPYNDVVKMDIHLLTMDIHLLTMDTFVRGWITFHSEVEIQMQTTYSYT